MSTLEAAAVIALGILIATIVLLLVAAIVLVIFLSAFAPIRMLVRYWCRDRKHKNRVEAARIPNNKP